MVGMPVGGGPAAGGPGRTDDGSDATDDSPVAELSAQATDFGVVAVPLQTFPSRL
jgi:hypothetical protein